MLRTKFNAKYFKGVLKKIKCPYQRKQIYHTISFTQGRDCEGRRNLKQSKLTSGLFGLQFIDVAENYVPTWKCHYTFYQKLYLYIKGTASLPVTHLNWDSGLEPLTWFKVESKIKILSRERVCWRFYLFLFFFRSFPRTQKIYVRASHALAMFSMARESFGIQLFSGRIESSFLVSHWPEHSLCWWS